MPGRDLGTISVGLTLDIEDLRKSVREAKSQIASLQSAKTIQKTYDLQVKVKFDKSKIEADLNKATEQAKGSVKMAENFVNEIRTRLKNAKTIEVPIKISDESIQHIRDQVQKAFTATTIGGTT